MKLAAPILSIWCFNVPPNYINVCLNDTFTHFLLAYILLSYIPIIFMDNIKILSDEWVSIPKVPQPEKLK